MSIEPAFKEVLIRRYVLEQLLIGNTPTGADIEQYLEDFIRVTHPTGFEIPLTNDLELSIPSHSEATASLYNDFLDASEVDLETVNTGIFNGLQKSLDHYDRWQLELEKLRTRSSNLRDRLEALLLLRSDTDGYFDSFNEDFYTTEYIDSLNTTALVDTGDGKVTLGLSRPDTPLSIYKVDTNRLTREDITLRVLQARGFASISEVDALPITNLVKDVLSGWSCVVNTTTGTAGVTLELVIRLSRSDLVSVNRVKTDISASSISGGLLFTLSYSRDGTNWSLVPTEFHTKRVTIKDDFAFPTVEARYFKFVIVNDSPDLYAHGKYLYDFSMRNIHFYNERYLIGSGQEDVVTSRDIGFDSNDGTPRSISKATLEVCEEIPEDTDIFYEVRGYDEGETEWTDWIPISPFNRENKDYTTIAQFSSEAIKNSTSGEETTKLNISQDIRSLNSSRLDTDDLIMEVAFNRESLAPLNYYISAGTFNSLVRESPKVYRNIGLKEFKFPILPEDLTVRNVSGGWRESSDGTSYETYIMVNSSDGFVIDLGGSIARINNVRSTGRIVLPKGIHLFTTNKVNWQSLTGTVPATLDDLKAIDPLYPLNHKYIIEGYQYPSEWTAEKVYIGVDRYFALVMRRLSALDIRYRHDPEDLSVFALERTDLENNTSRGIFLVNYNLSYSDYSNEMFETEVKVRDSDVDIVQWRATLRSESSDRSPVLSFVRLKVG